MRKKILNNITSNLFLNIITMIINLIIPNLIIQHYGSVINGLTSSIKQFVNSFKIVEAGIGEASKQALYKPIIENKIDKINGIMSATRIFYIKTSLIFTAIIVIGSIIYPLLVQNETSYIFTFILFIIISGSTIIEYSLFGKYSVLLFADQRISVLSFVQTIALIINGIVTIILIYLDVNYIFIQLIPTILYLLRVIVIAKYVKLIYPKLKYDVEPNLRAIDKRWDVLYHQIAGLMVFNTPIILLTLFGNLKEVSIFSVYSMVFSGVTMILGSISSGYYASLGQLAAEQNTEKLNNHFSIYKYIYYIIATILFSSCIVLIIPFMKLYSVQFIDAGYVEIKLAIAFLIYNLFNGLRNPHLSLINVAGHFKETKKRALIEGIVNIVVASVLIIPLGIYGILIGLIVCFTYSIIEVIRYSNKNILKQRDIKSYRDIMLVVITIVTNYIIFRGVCLNMSTSWINWILVAIFITIGVLVVTMIIFSMFKDNREKFRRIIQSIIVSSNG